MSIEDIIQEHYNQGLADGMRVLSDAIKMYREVKGHYPNMEYLVEQMIPDLIENMPDIVRVKKAEIRLN